MDHLVDQIHEALRSHGLRITKQRRAILAVLFEHKGHHLNAEEIHSLVSVSNPEIGLATVYRTLDAFVTLSICQKLDFGDKGARYELVYGEEGHYHHHLFCTECGRIIEVNEDLLESVEEKIAKEKQFRIMDHTLRFYGICRDCREEAGELEE